MRNRVSASKDGDYPSGASDNSVLYGYPLDLPEKSKMQ